MSKINDSKAALAALDATNDRLANHMTWPMWRHMAGGMLMTVIIAAAALPPAFAAAAMITAMVLAIVIVRDDKKRYGMFVSGYQRGRTGWIVAAIIVLALTALIVLLTQVRSGAWDPVFWVTLAVMFAGTSVLSLVWERVYRKDIRERLV